MKKVLILSLVALPALVFAQTNDKTSSKTTEDAYSESSVEVQVIRSFAHEQERSKKLRSLDMIQKMLENKKVTEKSHDIIILLGELSNEGVDKEVRREGRLINNYPDVRRKAAELLGQLPSDKSRELLINIADQDQEPMVISEAIYSLSLIGGGSIANRVESVIINRIRKQNAISPDNNFAYAAVSAIEMLGKEKQGKLNPDLFSSLLMITEGNYIKPVRKKAEKVLEGFIMH